MIKSSSQKFWRSVVGRLSPTTSYGAHIRFMSSATSHKLFIGGLTWSTDDNSLRNAFSSYGEISEAKVIIDKMSGRSKGYGFVTFSSIEEAEKAKNSMDGQDLNGRSVRVDFAVEKPPPARAYGGFGNGGSGEFSSSGGSTAGFGGNGGYGGGSSGGYGGSGHYNATSSGSFPGSCSAESNDFGNSSSNNKDDDLFGKSFDPNTYVDSYDESIRNRA